MAGALRSTRLLNQSSEFAACERTRHPNIRVISGAGLCASRGSVRLNGARIACVRFDAKFRAKAGKISTAGCEERRMARRSRCDERGRKRIEGAAPCHTGIHEQSSRRPLPRTNSYGEAGPYSRIRGWRVEWRPRPAGPPEERRHLRPRQGGENAAGLVEVRADFSCCGRPSRRGAAASCLDVTKRGQATPEHPRRCAGQRTRCGSTTRRPARDAGLGFLWPRTIRSSVGLGTGRRAPITGSARFPVALENGNRFTGLYRDEFMSAHAPAELVGRRLAIPPPRLDQPRRGGGARTASRTAGGTRHPRADGN